MVLEYSHPYQWSFRPFDIFLNILVRLMKCRNNLFVRLFVYKTKGLLQGDNPDTCGFVYLRDDTLHEIVYLRECFIFFILG